MVRCPLHFLLTHSPLVMFAAAHFSCLHSIHVNALKTCLSVYILPSHAVSGRFYLSCMVMTIQLDHLFVFLFFPSFSLSITATVRGIMCCLQARGRGQQGGEGEKRVIVGRAWVQSR